MFLTDFHNVLNTEQSYHYDKRHNAIPTGWIRFFITHKSSLKALQQVMENICRRNKQISSNINCAVETNTKGTQSINQKEWMTFCCLINIPLNKYIICIVWTISKKSNGTWNKYYGLHCLKLNCRGKNDCDLLISQRQFCSSGLGSFLVVLLTYWKVTHLHV